MSDTTTTDEVKEAEAPAGQVEISLDLLKKRAKVIAELDEKLDSAAGSSGAGKRAIGNRLSEAGEIPSVSQNTVNQISAFADKQESEELAIGLLVGIRNLFNSTFEKRIDEYLEAQVKTLPEAEKISQDELKTLADQRKEEVKLFKAMKEMLSLFGMDVDSVENPKRRTGARGPRGQRAISKYTWEVDGVRLPGKSDTIAGVAAQEGYGSAKELRDALTAAGIDLKAPPEEITFTTKDGKTLVGTKIGSEIPDDDDEDDDEEDDDVETGETSVTV